MLHMCGYPWCQKRALDSPEQELPDGVLGTQLSPLEKQQVLLTVEPYLQLLYLVF